MSIKNQISFSTGKYQISCLGCVKRKRLEMKETHEGHLLLKLGPVTNQFILV